MTESISPSIDESVPVEDTAPFPSEVPITESTGDTEIGMNRDESPLSIDDAAVGLCDEQVTPDTIAEAASKYMGAVACMLEGEGIKKYGANSTDEKIAAGRANKFERDHGISLVKQAESYVMIASRLRNNNGIETNEIGTVRGFLTSVKGRLEKEGMGTSVLTSYLENLESKRQSILAERSPN
jgi:hypothetical protein